MIEDTCSLLCTSVVDGSVMVERVSQVNFLEGLAIGRKQ